TIIAVTGSGVCNFSLPHRDFLNGSISLFNSSNASVFFVLNGSALLWNCSDAESPYRVEWATPGISASESWAQNTSAQSNLSTQFLAGTVLLSNPSLEDYSNVSFAVVPPAGFVAASNASTDLLAANSSQTIQVSASGDVLGEAWSGFAQHGGRRTVAGGTAWIANGLSVANNASLAFSGVAVSAPSRGGWNCSAPSSVDVAGGGSYVNDSFEECWADGVVSLNESGWAYDSTAANTVDVQYFTETVYGSNSESIPFSGVAASVAGPGGSLVPVAGTRWDDVFVAANGNWSRKAVAAGDWINESFVDESNSTHEWRLFRAENLTGGLSNVTAWIDFGDVEGGSDFLQLNKSGKWVDLTPFTVCPAMSSFVVDGVAWKSCGKDVDGDGDAERFEFVIPHFSVVVLRAGGRKAFSPATPTPSSGSGGATQKIVSDSWNSTPSPSASPAPLAPQPVEIIVANEVGEGLHTVRVDGGKAGDAVKIISPAGKVYERVLGGDGSFDFFFDEEGVWRIDYGNHSKEVRVSRERIAAPPKKEVKAQDKASESTATGFFAAGFGGGLEWLAVLLVAAALVAARLLAGRRGASLRKKLESGVVTIEVRAGSKPLKNLVLTDVVPEGCAAAKASEKAARKETVLGTALKWKKKELGKGGKWVVRYDLIGRPEKLKHAELRAESSDGEVVASSGEVEV
ncbi:MAG: hypothetical protein ACP5O3_02320, partial [Candidatus Micrarchaeia archaeon]